MMQLTMLPAGHGDCLLLEYGDQAQYRVLIDGGTSGTWKRLASHLSALPPEQRHFELVMVTHIDADHIAGMLKLLDDDALGIRFDDFWFNGYCHLPATPLESLGAVQGERLTSQLVEGDLPWNRAFGGRAVRLQEGAGLPQVVLPGGLSLTLLSPDRDKLAELRPKWAREVRKAGLDPSLPAEQPPPVPPALESLGLPDVERLADAPFEPDGSEANGSSIAVLAEYDGRRLLLTGDAHADRLAASIRRLNCWMDQPRLRLDAFKLPHHGSKANLSRELLELIDCPNYLVSTNGAYFHHPDAEAMARIIRYGGEAPTLWFNYRSDDNAVWASPQLQQRYGYRTRYPEGGEAGVRLAF